MKKTVMAVVVLLVGCGKPPGAAGPEGRSGESAAGKPDFDAMGAREATGLAEQRVTGPGGRFTGKALALATPKVSREDNDKATMVEIPIGSGEPMRCEVFDEEIDAGGTMGNVLANAGTKVQIQRVAPWAIEVVDEAPVTFVHALYTVATPKGKALGELKLAIHAAAGHPVFCSHDELGYEKTFIDGVKAFSGSLEHSGKAPPKASFVEVAIAKLKGTPVGFTKTALFVDGGDRRYADTTMIIMPVSASELRVEDDYSVQHVDAEERLASGLWVNASGGQVDLNITVKRTKGASYHYAGQVQGKKIDGTFSTKDGKGLASELFSVRELERRSKGKAPYSFEVAYYRPGTDPTRPITERYSREGSDAPETVHAKVGSTMIHGTLDELGLMKTAEFPIGGMSLTFERAFIRGRPLGG